MLNFIPDASPSQEGHNPLLWGSHMGLLHTFLPTALCRFFLARPLWWLLPTSLPATVAQVRCYPMSPLQVAGTVWVAALIRRHPMTIPWSGGIWGLAVLIWWHPAFTLQHTGVVNWPVQVGWCPMTGLQIVWCPTSGLWHARSSLPEEAERNPDGHHRMISQRTAAVTICSS